MLKTTRSYEEACRTFRWRIPDRYNLAFDVCDRQTMAGSDGHRTALIVEAADGSVERYTFHVLRLLSNRLANVLTAAGVGAGDRVLLSLPAGIEAASALLAVTKMGAVVVPVPVGLGTEPMGWRLADSGARAAIVGKEAIATVLAAEPPPPLCWRWARRRGAPLNCGRRWRRHLTRFRRRSPPPAIRRCCSIHRTPPKAAILGTPF